LAADFLAGRLFLDASVLIAAAGSPDGGSALLLEICRAKSITVLVTRLVLREAERNVQLKLGEPALLRFYKVIADLDPEVVPIPIDEDLAAASQVIAAKDAHVLAGAQNSGATHLVTLDRKHFLGEDQRKRILPIVACTPSELLRLL